MRLRSAMVVAVSTLFILGSSCVSTAFADAAPSAYPTPEVHTFATDVPLPAGPVLSTGAKTHTFATNTPRSAGPVFHTAAGTTTTTMSVTYESDTALPAGTMVSVADLPALAQASLASASTASTITPDSVTTVPPGYILRGTSRNGYIYTSNNAYLIDEECDDQVCSVLQDIRVTAKEGLIGGSSHDWNITFFSTDDSGPGGPGQNYHFSGGYGCGLRPVTGSGLLVCYGEVPGASNNVGPETFPVNGSNVVRESFGTVNGITVFPYQHFHVTFASGHIFYDDGTGGDGDEGFKFRDWDVCTSATDTKFCGVTGMTT